MKRFIKASTHSSAMSFDFVWDDDYDMQEVESAAYRALSNCGVEMTGIDFYSVDYSMYPEYADRNVSQCGVDFTWTDDYDRDMIEEQISSEMLQAGYEVIGINFETLDFVE